MTKIRLRLILNLYLTVSNSTIGRHFPPAVIYKSLFFLFSVGQSSVPSPPGKYYLSGNVVREPLFFVQTMPSRNVRRPFPSAPLVASGGAFWLPFSFFPLSPSFLVNFFHDLMRFQNLALGLKSKRMVPFLPGLLAGQTFLLFICECSSWW